MSRNVLEQQVDLISRLIDETIKLVGPLESVELISPARIVDITPLYQLAKSAIEALSRDAEIASAYSAYLERLREQIDDLEEKIEGLDHKRGGLKRRNHSPAGLATVAN